MPKAKKLPSGSWRCQVFSHYEEIFQKDGTVKRKRIYKSFTVEDPSPKGKKKCEAMATEWSLKRDELATLTRNGAYYTVSQAIEEYIAIKENVLSPSTIREYKRMSGLHFTEIGTIRLDDLTTPIIQKWINGMVPNRSAKSVKNIYGLLSAACKTFLPDKTFHVQLPQKKLYEGHVPTDADIVRLIDYLKNDHELLKAVNLAAFGTLRRSEICALTADDVNRSACVVHVHKAMVLNDKDIYVTKDVPKNSSSDRYVEYPEEIIKLLPKEGRIVNLNPDVISMRFIRAVRYCGLQDFRFHDLRHYAASVMHALGVPDQYIMERGGWSSDGTLKRIYRNSMDDYRKKFTAITNDHYRELMQHDMQHEKKKAL